MISFAGISASMHRRLPDHFSPFLRARQNQPHRPGTILQDPNARFSVSTVDTARRPLSELLSAVFKQRRQRSPALQPHAGHRDLQVTRCPARTTYPAPALQRSGLRWPCVFTTRAGTTRAGTTHTGTTAYPGVRELEGLGGATCPHRCAPPARNFLEHLLARSLPLADGRLHRSLQLAA